MGALALVARMTKFNAPKSLISHILHVVEAKGQVLVLILQRHRRERLVASVEKLELQEDVGEISRDPSGLEDGHSEREVTSFF